MVKVLFYSLPECDFEEVLRYAGAGKTADGKNEDMTEIVKECMEEAKIVRGRVCFERYKISAENGKVKFPFAEIESEALSKNLSGCSSAVVFAATVGIGIDRLIRKYGSTDTVKALFMQAIGTERVEALCDAFCRDLSEKVKHDGYSLKPRFSPGYGDLSLDVQKKITEATKCAKNIGVTLNDGMLMSPSKSVTAIVGLYKGEER